MFETKPSLNITKERNVIFVEVTENLDFHHFHGLTELLEIWLKKEQNYHNFRRRNIRCSRQDLYKKNTKELYEAAVTLCHSHHMKITWYLWKTPKTNNSKETRTDG